MTSFSQTHCLMNCSFLMCDVLVDVLVVVSNWITPMIPASRFGQDNDLRDTW